MERVKDTAPIVARNMRLSYCVMVQRKRGMEVLFAEDAEDGFTARALVGEAIERPTFEVLEEGERRSAANALALYQSTIRRMRDEADDGLEYRDEEENAAKRFEPVTVELTDAAHALLAEYGEECGETGEQCEEDGRPGDASRRDRSPEMVARLAAVGVAYRAYEEKSNGPLVVDEADVEMAIHLERWFVNEHERLSGEGARAQDATDARDWGAALGRHFSKDQRDGKITARMVQRRAPRGCQQDPSGRYARALELMRKNRWLRYANGIDDHEGYELCPKLRGEDE